MAILLCHRSNVWLRSAVFAKTSGIETASVRSSDLNKDRAADGVDQLTIPKAQPKLCCRGPARERIVAFGSREISAKSEDPGTVKRNDCWPINSKTQHPR